MSIVFVQKGEINRGEFTPIQGAEMLTDLAQRRRASVLSQKCVNEIKVWRKVPFLSFERVCFVWRARNPRFRDASRGSHARE
jgi:hypothetical protein